MNHLEGIKKLKMKILLQSVLITIVIGFLNAGEKFDVLIMNGQVLDGTGNPWYSANIGIKDGKILYIGRSKARLLAKRVIDAKGLTITPGFIDIHSHAYDRFRSFTNEFTSEIGAKPCLKGMQKSPAQNGTRQRMPVMSGQHR